MSNEVRTQYCPPSDTVAMGSAKTHCHCFVLALDTTQSTRETLTAGQKATTRHIDSDIVFIMGR
jgi:hypothetical protein